MNEQELATDAGNHEDVESESTAVSERAEAGTTSTVLRRTNSLAVVSLVAAVFWFGGIPAIVLGNVALTQIRKYDERGKWMAVTGLVLGYLSLLFWAVFALLAFLVVSGITTWISQNQPLVQDLLSNLSQLTSGSTPANVPADPTIQVGPDGLNYYVYPDGTWVPVQ